jgi:transcriptional regulator with GAF, ATPase, and Fis domain
MDLTRQLLDIARLLLREDEEKTSELLLGRLVEAAGAERGFLVVRAANGYAEACHVRFDRRGRTREERSFSRSLVRQTIESGQILHSASLEEDPRFGAAESARALGPCSVLAAPLRAGGEVYGAVYLDHRRPDAFTPATREFLHEFTELAGLFLRRSLEREALRERNRALEHDLFARHDFAGIVTRHPGMIELLKLVAQAADSDATVLIRGETGTGKELVAQALYVNSPRSKKPFVALHCTALPGSILESELFGHVRGAFTGAERDRAGRIATADGGTLFLDEIAEIPLELQAKLLRFLQFGEIQRLGSDRTERVDVRIVAATHQDLGALVKAGRFRQDLYFRLKVIELHIPPLRERKSDLPLLVAHFLREHWKRPGETPRLTIEAERALNAYPFPGNVRELEHLLERCCVLATGPEIGLALLPEELRAEVPPGEAAMFAELSNDELKRAREAAADAVERRFIEELLRRSDGNVSRAARESGMNRSYLQRLVGKHGLQASGDPAD